MPKLSHAFTTFIRNELRLAVSLGVLLLVLVGLSLAIGNSYQFDFGDGSAGGLELGYLAVDGGASMYPVNSSDIQYGWLDDTLAFSNGAAVSSRLNRDGNKGVNPARFRITGLVNGNYRLSLVVGSLDTGFATKVVTSGRSFSTTTEPNQWKTLTFDAEVQGGSLELLLQRAGTSLWGIDALTVAPSPTPAVKPTFDVTVQPALHTVRVGGTAVYQISISPLNGYASPVDLSITGLVGGITAQFSPVSAIPPLTADLTIVTAANTPLTQYDFVVIAKGRDADIYTVNKSLSLVVTDSAAVPTKVTPAKPAPTDAGSGGQTGSNSSSIDDAYLTPRTSEEVRSEQKFVDEYAATEAKKLANTKEILEIKDIGTINSFEAVPKIEAKTPFESSLQYMTAAGIIGTTVDSAPPAPQAAPKPIGFWERLFKTMVNPTL